MAKYLISFPSNAMIVPAGEFQQVVDDSHALVREIKAAGAWVFGGGINEDVAPVLIAADGTTTVETYPETRELNGGFTVIEVATRDEALMWAARTAAACRCSQELREWQYDPES